MRSLLFLTASALALGFVARPVAVVAGVAAFGVAVEMVEARAFDEAPGVIDTGLGGSGQYLGAA